MGLFSFLFGGGKYPSTSKYEAQLAQQQADYERFLKIASSAQIKRLDELKKLTESSDFKNRVNKLKNDKFESTEEYRKEQELAKLLKSSDVKAYYKFVEKDEQAFKQALASSNYKQYQEIEKTANSAAVQTKAKQKDPEAMETVKKYAQLAGTSEVKLVNKTLASSAYKSFKAIDGSVTLKKIDELKAFVASDAFVAKKKDLTNKNRFRESQECKDLEELASLTKDKDLKWYAEKAAKNAFADIAKWGITFQEDFAGSKLDSARWTLGYYLGVKNLKCVYSLADERQAFDAKNAVIKGGTLAIETKPGKVKGTKWDQKQFGFVGAEFDCSSALVNTGAAFRQKYGRFVFKVKASGAQAPVSHNIWLSSEKGAEVNVASFMTVGKKNTKTLMVGNGKNTADVTDVKFDNDYYIYTLDWTADKMVWSVNGVEVYSTKQAPQEEMYIGISTNVIGEGNISAAELDVEWIKVYSQK